jgi:hypothetical protein
MAGNRKAKALIFAALPVSGRAFVLIAALAVLLAGCATVNQFTVVDPELSEDEIATVTCLYQNWFTGETWLSEYIYFSSYNGVRLNSLRTQFLKIPAGRTTFFGGAVVTWGVNGSQQTEFRTGNLEFTYRFEGGKEYYLKPVIEGDGRVQTIMGNSKVVSGELKLYINIYEVEILYDKKTLKNS